MHISDQGILVILLVGLVAGWLAGRIVDGGGFGLIGDIAVGIVSEIIVATIGAILLLLIVRFATGAFPRRRAWRL